MNRTAKYLLTILTAIQCVSARSNSTEEHTLLWRIESPNGGVSHLFGTIHLPDSTVFRQRDTVLQLLDASTTFFGELDLDSAASPLLALKMMLPKGTTLASYFTADEVEEIRAALRERLGPMAAMAERMKPAAILGMMMMDGTEATAPMSIDQFLWERAGSGGLSRYGLERLDEQIAVLDSMPARLLLEAIREPESEDSVMFELIRAYAEEDVPAIARLVDSLSAVESFMQRLNDDRNVQMVRRLHEPLRRGNTFIAVGAAHLAGEQGLVSALRREGYQVRPVLGGRRIQWLAVPAGDPGEER